MPCRRPGVARGVRARAFGGGRTRNLLATLHPHVHTPTVMPTEFTVHTHDTQSRQPVSLPVERPRQARGLSMHAWHFYPSLTCGSSS